MDLGFIRCTRADGNVFFKRVGKFEIKPVPTAQACRERLQKLIADAQGDWHHPSVTRFWIERADDVDSKDPMIAAWALEVYQILSKEWEILNQEQLQNEFAKCEEILPPQDVFSQFGL